MTEALLLKRADLENTLDVPAVLAALEEAFHAERRREWDTPQRIAAHTRAGALLAMPCGGSSPPSLGAKLVSTFPGNGALGLPSVSGLYALFDATSGVPIAVMDGGYLTLIRTAAVSALAARLLSRPDARTLGLLGAGAQARFHARLFAAVRPIETVMIWSRRKENASALIASLAARPDLGHIKSWMVCDDARPAAGCDLVVTATAATAPVLEGGWLVPGSHVTAIGAHTRHTREIDADAVVRASTLLVETTDTLLEAGDFQLAEGERGGVISRVETLGAFLDPERPKKPRDPLSIGIFKSCGVAFEDLAVAGLAYRRARSKGLGEPFRFD